MLANFTFAVEVLLLLVISLPSNSKQLEEEALAQSTITSNSKIDNTNSTNYLGLPNTTVSFFALNYSHSHAMTGYFYQVSYNSNTNEMALSNYSGYKLYNTTITETSKNRLKDTILQTNFFQTQSNGPPYVPDSTIEELSIYLDGKEHRVEWGHSQDKEVSKNLLMIADLIKDVLCMSSPDIVISSTRDFGPPNYLLCHERST